MRPLLPLMTALALIAFPLACATPPGDAPSTSKLPPAQNWENLYAGDPGLAGVVVVALPEGRAIEGRHAETYAGRHPCQLQFAFWDGRVHQRNYSPEGQLTGEVWWRWNPGDGWWKEVDFRHGSDPHFKHHADPRKAP